MGLLDVLKSVNVDQATRKFLLLAARKKADRYLRIVGPRRIHLMIARSQDLDEIIHEFLSPEQQQQLKEQAAKYKWVNELLTDEELVSVVPQWAMAVVEHHGPAGKDWLARQIAWLRSLAA